MRSTYRVPFSRRGSVLGAAELTALSTLVDSGDSLSQGVWRNRFEERFAELVNVPYALSVTSGTVALEIAIRLLDLGRGDEVIVTPQTFQATVQPLLEQEATVRFCDVDADTLNVDPVVLESLITDRTRAIILVHYGGLPAEMARITAMARARGIVVVEDCAHALGAFYHGVAPGGLGDIGCFSFHTSKNITTLGEGGMITVRRDDWARRIGRIRSNAVDAVFVPSEPGFEEIPAVLPWMMYSSDQYRQRCIGLGRAGTNATMSEAAAAVGLVQLERLGELTERRRQIASKLDDVVRSFPGTRTHSAGPGVTHANHLYTFFVDGGQHVRDGLIFALDRRGIEVQLRYFPQHLVPEWQWRGHRKGECPVAERLWFTEHVNLPCHPAMSDAQVDYLVDALEASLAETRGVSISLGGRVAAR
ncbi:MAG: DegT/DnrJ/EryC1/StrS family aminotransferase [Kutzneria sp.]|nr:DegT/DnrJ/EryC1/StrS family aminotransferase [Kutzneria sp.]MBV9847727.1 DegT/DnrJ/EryC1/StrS family aminotransferase [Kutzneria sp.]